MHFLCHRRLKIPEYQNVFLALFLKKPCSNAFFAILITNLLGCIQIGTTLKGFFLEVELN